MENVNKVFKGTQAAGECLLSCQEENMKETNYIALKCLDCGIVSIFPAKTADGNVCLSCGGYTVPAGYAILKDKRQNDITVKTRDMERIADGGRLYDALSLKNDRINFRSIIDYDSQDKALIIKEKDLISLICLINNMDSQCKKIRLI